MARKLTDQQVLNIRENVIKYSYLRRAKPGCKGSLYSNRSIARALGVSPNLIDLVVRGYIYKGIISQDKENSVKLKTCI